jgi:hypothetical protein
VWKAVSSPTVSGTGFAVQLEARERHNLKWYVNQYDDPQGELQRHCDLFRFSVQVSGNHASIYHTDCERIEFSYVLIPRSYVYQRLPNAPKLRLQDDAEFLSETMDRFHLMDGDKRRRFRELLDEFCRELGRANRNSDWELARAVERIESGLVIAEEQQRDVVDALLSHGFLGLHVEQAVRAEIEKRRDEIETIASKTLGELAVRQKSLQDEADTLEEQIAARSAAAADDLDKDRRRFQREMAEERNRLFAARQELKKQSEKFHEVVAPIVERMESSRTELIQEFLAIEPLLRRPSPTLEDTRPTARYADRSTETKTAPTGKPFEQWAEFVEQRLWPLVLDWQPCVSRKQVELFHAALLGCRIVLVPDTSWSVAYAQAVHARHAIVSVEPDWLGFERLWATDLKQMWEMALSEPDQIVIVALEGIDRSPTTAWSQPLLTIAGGHRNQLPGPSGLPWPKNLRVVATVEESTSCFTLSSLWKFVAGGVTREKLGDAPANLALAEGHVPAATWLAWAAPDPMAIAGATEAFEGVELEGPYRLAALHDCHTLAHILATAGEDVDAAWRMALRCRLKYPTEYVGCSDE